MLVLPARWKVTHYGSWFLGHKEYSKGLEPSQLSWKRSCKSIFVQVKCCSLQELVLKPSWYSSRKLVCVKMEVFCYVSEKSWLSRYNSVPVTRFWEITSCEDCVKNKAPQVE